MKIINFIVVRLAISLVTGIMTSKYFVLSFSVLKWIPVCLLILLVIWFRERKRLRKSILFGVSTYLTFFFFGYGSYQIRLPSFQTSHYTQVINYNKPQFLQLKIKEVLKSDNYYHKYLSQLQSVGHEATNGTLLLYIQKDTIVHPWEVDDVVLAFSEIKEIPIAANPYQFSYKNYLKELRVYHKMYSTPNQILKHQQGSKTIIGYSERIRKNLIAKLSNTSIAPPQLSIVQALILGQRKDIDRKLYSNYAAAGAVHILAVSGLHVGILFLLLSWIVKPLHFLPYGKQTSSILITCLLWSFAVLAGLSPSVVRAVTMFSFFALAGLLERPTHSFNTLFLSFLVLVLFRPNWLFHVGFQLSYLAVFFILWIQPKLYKLYRPRYRLDRLFWGIITVTTAAQLGVAPLSLYYFHQFPGLFFLTNLVVLPFLTILLIGGILVVILAALNSLPDGLAVLYDWMIKQLNGFIGWIANQNQFLLEDISFSEGSLITTYSLLLCGLGFWQQKSARTLSLLMASIILFLAVGIWENKILNKEQLVLFHRSKRSILGHQKNRRLILFQSDTVNYARQYPIKSFKIGSGATSISSEALSHVFTYKNKKILRLDSLGVYPSENIDIVILTQSPRMHLDRLIDSIHPSLIIADGSNYKSYVQRWKTTCIKRKIPFHSTYEKGAYIFNKE